VTQVALQVDKATAGAINLHIIDGVAGSRLIVAPTGPLDRDQDDVRCLFDAACSGVARAKAAGAIAPIIVADPSLEAAGFENVQAVLLLGALFAQYSTLQNREFSGEAKAQPVRKLAVLPLPSAAADIADIIKRVRATEAGRRVARDICGADPARMTNLNAYEYVKGALGHLPNITITAVTDLPEMEKDYPCAYAVGRASELNPKHYPVIMRVEYTPPADVQEQVYFAGKGITYDTGGADVKAGGIMAGMKRDCGGAAAAAGFMRTVGELQPANLRVVAYLGFVRNDIGPTMYVGDEIIVSHAGKRVLVVNTDAEGRMVMCDLLSHIREEVLAAKQDAKLAAARTTVHSIATLTGHAVVAVGKYSICLDNGVSKMLGVSPRLVAAGDSIADPFETSTMRRDDFAMVAPKRDDHDVVQCNALPSSRTPRGHQFPAVFMYLASGLVDHGPSNTETPIAYTHLDIAGSAAFGDSAGGVETGNPVCALVEAYIPK